MRDEIPDKSNESAQIERSFPTSCWKIINFAPLAQLVEQWPLKPTVGGSIPSRRTKNHQITVFVLSATESLIKIIIIWIRSKERDIKKNKKFYKITLVSTEESKNQLKKFKKILWRASFNGRTLGCGPKNKGSIPFARPKNTHSLEYFLFDHLELKS